MNIKSTLAFRNYHYHLNLLYLQCLLIHYINIEDTRKAEHELKSNERQLQRTQYDLERDEKKLACLYFNVSFTLT